MTKQTLIKGLIAVALGAQVFGLTPSALNDCHAQEGIKTVHELKKPAWVALGGEFQRGLSVVAGGSSIKVFGAGSDNGRWSIESADNGKTWGSFIDHKGGLLSAPSCDSEYHVPEQGAGVRCTWLSSNGFLWSQYQKYGGGDEGFVTMGGTNMTSDPSFVSGRIFVHGAAENALWRSHTLLGKLTGQWESLGGELKGSPSCLKVGDSPGFNAFSPSSPIIRCYVLGSDDGIWEWHVEVTSVNPVLPESHNVWKKIGGEAIGGVNAWNYKGTVLAVRGTDSNLWLAQWVAKTGEWQWENYPGKIASVPACSLSYCFAILPDGQLGFLNLTGRL